VRAIYVDTGAFIALIWRRDRAHERAREHFDRLRRDRDLLVTSDPVIGETTTRLRYDAGLPSVTAFVRIVEDAVAAGALRIRDTDPKLRRAAFDIMSAYADLSLSYVDCVGAAVAREIRADAVFGLDRDFRAMGFLLEPG
jgi:predicted nucleic acid-binding protein